MNDKKKVYQFVNQLNNTKKKIYNIMAMPFGISTVSQPNQQVGVFHYRTPILIKKLKDTASYHLRHGNQMTITDQSQAQKGLLAPLLHKYNIYK